MPSRWVTVDEFCQIDSDVAAELGHMNIPGRYVGGTRVATSFSALSRHVFQTELFVTLFLPSTKVSA